MADNSMTMSVDGLDDLMEAFERVVKKYPDRSGELLQTQAKLIRKEVINLVKNDTDTSGSSKRSLSKAKEYKISEIKGFGENQYIEVSGVAPHFHLLENGHQIILPRTRKNKKGEKVTLRNGGKNVGFAVGYHFFDRAQKKRAEAMPNDLEKMITDILKEEGLI